MRLLALTLCLFLGGAGKAPAQQSSGTATAQSPGKLALRAMAISTGGPLANPVFQQIDVVFERWSSQAAGDRLLKALKDGGQPAALNVLRDLPRAGFISTPGNLGLQLYYASSSPIDDGGKKIFAITDRPIGFAETVNHRQSLDYPFTVIELQLNASNEGSGKLWEAAQLTFLGKAGLMVENYTYTAVIDLTKVRPR
jgi:hypothetical protein